ncbi:Na(+)-translocating NADH-quinone reductase subunit B [Acidobacteria bacterium Mor1]|nr:Na(+)-translocating NADH-quinone reductase subunit B [Acidobacteria bacterium Mor1]
MEPLFLKGGKLEKLYPLWEAQDTFLFSPKSVTKTSAHVRDALDLKRMMSMVIVALIPCIFMAMYNTGLQANIAMENLGVDSQAGWRGAVLDGIGIGYDPGNFLACLLHGALFFLPVYIVCMAVGGAWEALFSIVRGHEINEGFLVTGMLFPLTLPPTIPLWQVAIGISFGVVVGKEIFGGTGRNFLNPALTARAFLYFAYSNQIVGDTVWTAVDGFSGATPLGAAAIAAPGQVVQDMVATVGSMQNAFLGTIQGSMGETSTLACIIGAAILIATGVGSWRIMAGCVAGAAGFAALLNWAGSDTNAMFAVSPLWHLVIGGFAFGTVFMATDPVSAAMTNPGKWVYGALIGAMTILIRVINPAYPEGIMLAILFGNVFAPLIDYFVVQSNIKRRLARYGA